MLPKPLILVFVDETGVDETVVDKTGVDELGCYHRECT